MLKLSDEQMHVIDRAADIVPAHDRGAFLRKVGDLLEPHREIGDGLVSRAVREAQQQFWRPPPISGAGRPRSRYV